MRDRGQWLFRSLWSRLIGLGFRLLYGKLAKTYDMVAWLASYGEWQSWCRTVLDHVAGSTVLELGHGPGHILCELHDRGFHTIGLDPSPQMGKLARDRLDRGGHPSIVIRGRAQNLPFPSQCFDSVVATFPTGYIYESRAVFEVARVLAPDGCLVVVLSAGLLRSGPGAHALEWAYRITGQRRTETRSQYRMFADAGLAVSHLEINTKTSKVTLMIAQRTTPRDRTGRNGG
jgi:ubiquinone/menaquinone biosynthesis C-methylase UbiE